jgi:hypothetical protein
MAEDSQAETNFKPAQKGRKEHRSHHRLIVFLVCLCISIMMWLFIELMKNYTDEIKYNITFENAPGNLILINGGDSVISIGMNAQGFELLVAKYAQKRRTLSIDLSSLKIHPSGDGFSAYLPSEKVIEQLGNQIRFEKEITNIKPDTLFFRFSEIFRKQVPVVPDVSYTLHEQYDVTDSLKFNPHYITVSSIKSIIDTLSFVKTQKLVLNDLDSTVNMGVALYKGADQRMIKFSSDSINISISVEKVTESSYTVPVSIKGDDKNLKIFPDRVEIICRVPLSQYSQIEKSDFTTEVEYLPSMKNEKKLRVKLVKFPEKIKIVKIVPDEVEYIIISK